MGMERKELKEGREKRMKNYSAPQNPESAIKGSRTWLAKWLLRTFLGMSIKELTSTSDV
jgi:hypothetical protein